MFRIDFSQHLPKFSLKANIVNVKKKIDILKALTKISILLEMNGCQ
jgi:hypothetical protein